MSSISGLPQQSGRTPHCLLVGQSQRPSIDLVKE